MSSHQIKMHFAWFIPAVLVTSFFFFMMTYFYSQRDFIKFTYSPDEIFPACSGGILKLERGMEFLRDVDLSITHAFVLENEDSTQTISKATIEVSRKKGILNQTRDLYVPHGMEHGVWELRTYITSREFPFWHNHTQAPVVLLDVYKTCP